MPTLDAPGPSGTIVRASAAEVLELPGGSMMRLLADSSATGGRLSAHFTVLAPGADGASPHHHTTATEMFYVVDGSLQVLVGDEVVLAGQGDLVVVPPGVAHAFAAASRSGAQLLVTALPGIERFELFRTIARMTGGGLEPPTVLLDQSGYDTYSDNSPAWREARLPDPDLRDVTAGKVP